MPDDGHRLPPRPDADTPRQMLGTLAISLESVDEDEPPTAEEIVEFERLGAMSEEEFSAEMSKVFNQTIERSKNPGTR